MARRGGFAPRRQGTNRLVQWVGPALQTYVAVASGGATLISSFTPGESLTIVRTRGMVSVRPESNAADVELVGAIGFGIVSDEAFAAGVASMPEPFNDADWSGWFVWRSFSYDIEFSDATGVGFLNWDFEVDSKAMRKLGPNETAVLIAESFTGAFRVSSPLRMLVKLS